LQSAHYLTISLDSPQNVEPQRYWKPNIDNTIEISREEATKEVQSIFLENMQLHLRSDVPIGSALSGGLDSTAIISVMRLLQPKLDIHTFSYVANQKSLSEESWIDIANSHVNGINHKVYANVKNLHNDLDHLIRLQGEPFGSTSIYAQYMVFQAAKAAGVKVMLDGQGADEMLAGYPVYVAARLASLLKQGKFALALQFLKNTQHLSSYTTSILKTGMFMFPQGVQNSVRSLIGQELVPPELDEKWLENSGVEIQSIRGSYGKNVLKEELKNTLTDLHLSSLLRFEDRNSMIHSIESRVPFLTPKLVDFLFSLPEEYLFDAQGNSKSIFRSAMKSIVPASIVQRKDKIGFETPEREWLREHSVWVESILSDVIVEKISIFKTHRLIEEWRDLLTNKKTFDFRVWRWINLILWTKSFKVQY
jgi:asparagine synthase (glutamine-hydrolysing)